MKIEFHINVEGEPAAGSFNIEAADADEVRSHLVSSLRELTADVEAGVYDLPLGLVEPEPTEEEQA